MSMTMVSMFARLHFITNSRVEAAVLPTSGGWAHRAWASRGCMGAWALAVVVIVPSTVNTIAATTRLRVRKMLCRFIIGMSSLNLFGVRWQAQRDTALDLF